MGRLGRAMPCGTRSLRIAARFLLLAAIGLTITACTGWPGPYGSVRHVKGNLMDRAVATFDESDMAAVARRGLLKRFPIGSTTADLRRYLRSIGGSCESGPGGPVVCEYSQYYIWGHRGIIGDERREYRYHDFTIRVWPGRGPIAKLTVCDTPSSEVDLGPMILSGRHKPRESKFKPCGDRSGKRRAINGDLDAR